MVGKKLFIFLLLLVVTCLGGCGMEKTAQKTETVVYKIAGEDYGYPAPYSFYPRGPGYCRMSLLFDTLLWKDREGQIIPWLCRSYTCSPDGKVWTFVLDERAKWHDGKPLTAEDVKFTFQYLQKHPHPSFTPETKRIAKVEAKGQQVIVYLKDVYAPFAVNIGANIPIIPKHIWEKVSDPLKFTNKESVIGSGPFRLEKYDKASSLYVYQANPDYYRGQVKAKRLIFMQPGQPVLALIKGDIDAFDPNMDQVSILKKNKAIEIVEGSGFWVFRLMFNLREKPFNEVKFRQAIAYALDLPDLVNRATHQGAIPGSSGYVSPEFTEWYNPQIASYPHDLAKANQLLEQLGYRDRNGDTIREMPDGRKMQFEMVCFNEGKEGELLKAMLQKVGIAVQIKALDKGAHDALIANGQYQMAVEGHGGIGGDPSFLNGLIFNKNEKKHSRDLYENPEYMALADQQIRLMDLAKRKEVVNKMQVLLAEEVPTIPLYYKKMFFAYRPGKIDDWFFGKGGIASGIPTSLNKSIFIADGE